jgi:carbon-monoxide dehydrogenase large subunit
MSTPTLDATRFGSGHTVRRIEDPTLVTGRGRFTDDLRSAGTATLLFLRSPYAHARLVSVDTAAAKARPGVLAVLAGADLVAAGVKPLPNAVPFPRPDGKPGVSAPRHALAVDRVRHVGEAVAAVVAESPQVALDALEDIAVEYDELPAVADPVDAMRPGAPALVDAAPDNVASYKQHGDAAAVQAAFERAAHRVTLDLVNQRVAAVTLEPRAVVAELEATPATASAGAGSAGGAGGVGGVVTARLVVTLSSQMPTAVRDGLAATLPGLQASQVRVLVGDVGGGFGMKTGLYPEEVVVAHAARTLGRRVAWTAQRSEEFTASVQGRDLRCRTELALDAAGRVLALRVRGVANVGAYALNVGVAIPLLIGPWVITSVYDIPCIDLGFTAVMTNTVPVGAYRGAGRPEAIFIIERLMDAAAQQLAIDPGELRRRNLIRPEQFPYTNPMAQVYDVGRFETMLDRALVLGDWGGFEARLAASKARGRLRGRSVTSFLEWTGGNVLAEQVTVQVLAAEGVIELTSATQAMGQGIATSYAQLAVDVFGVPIERIRIRQGDTDRATGFGSAGSRSLFTGGGAVHVASERTVDEARRLAGEVLEAAAGDIEYAAGTLRIAGTDRAIGLFDLAARQPGAHITVTAGAKAGAPSWPNACHVCEVEIDPETGAVDIAAYTSVNDIGRVVSPQIVRGQVEGGAIQGIGQALCEAVVYDRDTAQALSASFMDYALPRADGFIGFKTEFDTSVPCSTNVLGVKGVGELGTIGATPAVVNAVIDALARAGLGAKAQRLQMPLTAPVVWRALRGEIDGVELPEG